MIFPYRPIFEAQTTRFGAATRVPHIWHHATPEGLPWSLSHPAARSPKEFVLSSLAILIGAHFTIRIKENLLTTTGACGNGVKCKTLQFGGKTCIFFLFLGSPKLGNMKLIELQPRPPPKCPAWSPGTSKSAVKNRLTHAGRKNS